MATIHLIDGEKGGVGKSFVARTMIQYGLDRNLTFTAVETDRSNPDVAGVYQDICKFAVFSENEKQADQADRIFEMATEQPVIVSLPSQVHRSVKGWIERNKLFELSDEYGVNFCKWFVSNGEYDSVKLFCSSLDAYGSNIAHILVRNLGLCDDWSQIDNDPELQKLLKKYKVKVIDFPKLSHKERYTINKEQMRLDKARDYKEFGILGKQRVVNFLKSAYSAFDSAGVWQQKSPDASPSNSSDKS